MRKEDITKFSQAIKDIQATRDDVPQMVTIVNAAHSHELYKNTKTGPSA